MVGYPTSDLEDFHQDFLKWKLQFKNIPLNAGQKASCHLGKPGQASEGTEGRLLPDGREAGSCLRESAPLVDGPGASRVFSVSLCPEPGLRPQGPWVFLYLQPLDR